MFVDYERTPGWWTVWSSSDEDGRVLADGFRTREAAEAAMRRLAEEQQAEAE